LNKYLHKILYPFFAEGLYNIQPRKAFLLMRVLFIHQNIPGQFKYLISILPQRPGWEVTAIAEAPRVQQIGPIRGVKLIGYPLPQNAGEATHHYLRSTEAAVRRGQAVTRACLSLRGQGYVPDLIVVHPGWGENLYLKEVYPNTPQLAYYEFFYNTSGADINFDSEYPNQFDDLLRARTRNATQLIAMTVSDWGISPTYWQRAQYPEWYRSKISVIFDGVDTDIVSPRPNVSFELPDNKGTLTPTQQVITFINRNFEPYRGFHVFMRALPEILRRNPKAQVVMVGGDEISYGRAAPPHTTYRKMLLEELGTSLDLSRIHFVGRISYGRLLDLLRLSSAHIYFTYPFVLSWSMVEAMALGALVIGSATAPVMEVIEDGKNGLLVPFFDKDALVNTVSEVLAKPELYQTLRSAARATVIERYNLRECLGAQIRLMQAVARHGRP
jgi:glycosyltransferase involved in cell wall biosynthesis